MRQTLIDLIDKTIVYKYDLPHGTNGILKTIFSTENDKCYSVQDINDMAEIIYNSIIEYSFNEFELTENSYQNLHAIALQIKLKYNPDADDATKIKYGFFGEVLLYAILAVQFKAKPLIARGYFYNPLENAETKGYDSYQLVENNGNTELWFGEVKFHVDPAGGIKSVMDNIDKALSDKYFKQNILALQGHKSNFNITGSKIETILKDWEQNPSIVIADEIKKHNIKMVYPVLIIYQHDASDYDTNIKKVIDHIEETYAAKTFSMSIDFSVFLSSFL